MTLTIPSLSGLNISHLSYGAFDSDSSIWPHFYVAANAKTSPVALAILQQVHGCEVQCTYKLKESPQQHKSILSTCEVLRNEFEQLLKIKAEYVAASVFIGMLQCNPLNPKISRFLARVLRSQRACITRVVSHVDCDRRPGKYASPVVSVRKNPCGHIQFFQGERSYSFDECELCNKRRIDSLHDENGLTYKSKMLRLAVAVSTCQKRLFREIPPDTQKRTSILYYQLFIGTPASTSLANVEWLTEMLHDTIQEKFGLDEKQKRILSSLISQYESMLQFRFALTRVVFAFSCDRHLNPLTNVIVELATALQTAIEFRKRILNSLRKMKMGESIIVPFCTCSHSLILEFRKFPSGYVLVVYNTGSGAQHHGFAQKKGVNKSKHMYVYPFVVHEISLSTVEDLVCTLIELQTSLTIYPRYVDYSDEDRATDEIDALYKSLSKFGRVVRYPTADLPLLAYQIQSFGTCGTSCIQAWLRQYFKDQPNGAAVYRSFVMRELATMFAGLVKDPSQYAAEREKGGETLFPEEKELLLNVIRKALSKRLRKLDTPLWPEYEPAPWPVHVY
jgi:hypothetical protein